MITWTVRSPAVRFDGPADLGRDLRDRGAVAADHVDFNVLAPDDNAGDAAAGQVGAHTAEAAAGQGGDPRDRTDRVRDLRSADSSWPAARRCCIHRGVIVLARR